MTGQLHTPDVLFWQGNGLIQGNSVPLVPEYHYRAFGRSICSSIPLPLLQPTAVEAKVEQETPVVISESPRIGGRGDGVPAFFDGICRVAYPEAFDFVIDDAGISVSRYALDHLPLLQQRLLTTGLSSWFYNQQGYMQLHASVFDLQGARIAVVGRRGAGKSTALQDALLAGASLVADDVALIDGFDRIHASFPAYRLRNSHANASRVDQRYLGPVPGAVNKHYVAPDKFVECHACPADLVVHLLPVSGLKQIEARMLVGLERAQSIAGNGYRPRLYLRHPNRISLVENLLAYANRIRVLQIQRPESPHYSKSILPAVLEHL